MSIRARLRLYVGFMFAAYAAALLVIATRAGEQMHPVLVLTWVVIAFAFKVAALKAYKELQR